MATRATDERRSLTVREVAARLNVSEKLVYKLVASGALGSRRFGRALRIGAGDLDDYLARTHRAGA